MLFYVYLKVIAISLAVMALFVLLLRNGVFKSMRRWLHRTGRESKIALALLACTVILFGYASFPYSPHFAMPPMMHVHTPDALSPQIPIGNVLDFLFEQDRFEYVSDIGADPNAVPPPITRTEPELLKIALTAQEVISEIAPGVYFNYWTYDKQVPGPMLRVRIGDTIELSLTNHPSSMHPHNIDLHAVTGPGGGAKATMVMPGETAAFRWKALQPGLYVYHCATPNVSTHNSHGQYGLILVEPEGGLPPVDHEWYVMQGELYTMGGLGAKGLVPFDADGLLDGIPTYITFNGKVETTPRMKMNVGETARIYAGNGGVNLISSFHPIGEIWDLVYPEGAIGSDPHANIQTTAVLPGGSSIVEFKAEVPGNLVLVDHALARMNKGAWAIVEVAGDPQPDVFEPLGKTTTIDMGNSARSAY